MVGHQESLGSVRQRLTHTVEAAVVKRDQTVAISKTDSDCLVM